MHAHAAFPLGGPFLAAAATWFGMMTLMMAPTVWPWVRAFHRFGLASASGTSSSLATAMFAAGYLAAWMIYSVSVAGLQTALPSIAGLGSALLIVAGVFQFTPLKRACLTHCRNPLTWFLSKWGAGAGAGFRMGFGHGVFCVGCCWALMATMLAVGVTSVLWMAAVAAVTLAEQTFPHGDRLRRPLGAVLVIAGLIAALT